MRFLLYFNMIAIVIILASLGQIYEGTPLPWRLTFGAPSVTTGEPVTPDQTVVPEENAKRLDSENLPAAAADLSALHVLTEGSYPPFNGRNSAGKLVGYDIDMANALCARIKRRCEIETRAWSNLLPALVKGDGDVVIASMLIPVRDKTPTGIMSKVAFSKPYYLTPGHFAVRRDGGSMNAITRQKIAVQAGSTHEAFLKAHFPKAERVSVKTLQDAQDALANRRADLLFGDRNALLSWLKHDKQAACCQLVGGDYDDATFFSRGAGIVVKLEDARLLAQINQALSEFARDGTEAKIAQRYFGQSIR
jgi:polar amino acid transport system substrate-binding protein